MGRPLTRQRERSMTILLGKRIPFFLVPNSAVTLVKVK